MKVAGFSVAFSYTLWHVKISFYTSVSGQLGKEPLIVCPAASVYAVPCQQLHHQSSRSLDTTLSSYIQAFRMCAMALCLRGFMAGPT